MISCDIFSMPHPVRCVRIKEDGVSKGYAIVTGDKDLFIWFTYVDPENRRQGYGLKLIGILQETSETITVVADTTEGRKLYEKAGFKSDNIYQRWTKWQ